MQCLVVRRIGSTRPHADVGENFGLLKTSPINLLGNRVLTVIGELAVKLAASFVLSNNYDRHLAVTNTLMLDGLASLQKLVLQVCKSWQRVLRRLRDKLLRKTWSVMFYEGSIKTSSRPYSGTTTMLFRYY